MDQLNKSDKNLKKPVKNQIIFVLINFIGFLIFILGGLKLLVYISIALVFFLLGKYVEKTIQFIKDYRLQLRLSKFDYDFKNLDKVKKENIKLKSILDKEINKNKESFSIEDINI